MSGYYDYWYGWDGLVQFGEQFQFVQFWYFDVGYYYVGLECGYVFDCDFIVFCDVDDVVGFLLEDGFYEQGDIGIVVDDENLRSIFRYVCSFFWGDFLLIGSGIVVLVFLFVGIVGKVEWGMLILVQGGVVVVICCLDVGVCCVFFLLIDFDCFVVFCGLGLFFCCFFVVVFGWGGCYEFIQELMDDFGDVVDCVVEDFLVGVGWCGVFGDFVDELQCGIVVFFFCCGGFEVVQWDDVLIYIGMLCCGFDGGKICGGGFG